MYKLLPNELQLVFDVLQGQGFQVLGPRASSSSLAIGLLEKADDLPRGWFADQQPGNLIWNKKENSEEIFSYTTLLDSWKQVVFPASETLWLLGSNEPRVPESDEDRFVLIGLRACDVRALQVLDGVFLSARSPDSCYKARREALFIIAVECQKAAATCFCSAMSSGPRVNGGCDWVLTEMCSEASHYFLVRAQSERGRDLLGGLKLPQALPDEIESAHQGLHQVEQQTAWQAGQYIPEQATRQHYQHSHWGNVAQRCLACGNCTSVCPTCFCFDMVHHGGMACETSCTRQWSSCFSPEHSYLHGGPVRASIVSRYRQWSMHKLVTWHEQFGTSGCVGCGRCIVACPAAIDLRREAENLFFPEAEVIHGET